MESESSGAKSTTTTLEPAASILSRRIGPNRSSTKREKTSLPVINNPARADRKGLIRKNTNGGPANLNYCINKGSIIFMVTVFRHFQHIYVPFTKPLEVADILSSNGMSLLECFSLELPRPCFGDVMSEHLAHGILKP
jgi:hypothetical protein